MGIGVSKINLEVQTMVSVTYIVLSSCLIVLIMLLWMTWYLISVVASYTMKPILKLRQRMYDIMTGDSNDEFKEEKDEIS